jgi:hypothetical protein
VDHGKAGKAATGSPEGAEGAAAAAAAALQPEWSIAAAHGGHGYVTHMTLAFITLCAHAHACRIDFDALPACSLMPALLAELWPPTAMPSLALLLCASGATQAPPPPAHTRSPQAA